LMEASSLANWVIVGERSLTRFLVSFFVSSVMMKGEGEI
jgi:hypothetical protein